MKIIGIKQLDANDYLTISVVRGIIIVTGGTLMEKIQVSDKFSNSLRGCSSEEILDKVVDYYLDNTRLFGIRRKIDKKGKKHLVVEGPLKCEPELESETDLTRRPKSLRASVPLGSERSIKIVDKYLADREEAFNQSLGTGCNYSFMKAEDSYYRYSKKDNTMYFYLRKGKVGGKIPGYEENFFRGAIQSLVNGKKFRLASNYGVNESLSFEDNSKVDISFGLSRIANQELSRAFTKKDNKGPKQMVIEGIKNK